MRIMGLIPALYGSDDSRLRNIRNLGGHPLIAHSILSALESCLDRVIVSVDEPNLAGIARSYGADAPFLRPADLATNQTCPTDIVRHALDWVKHHDGYVPDAICYLPIVCPFRKPFRIDQAVELLTSDVDSVLSVVPVSQHPYQMFECEPSGRLLDYVQMKKKPEHLDGLPALYCASPFISITKTSLFERPFWGPRSIVNTRSFRPFYPQEEEAFEIRSTFDMEIASLLVDRFSENQLGAPLKQSA